MLCRFCRCYYSLLCCSIVGRSPRCCRTIGTKGKWRPLLQRTKKHTCSMDDMGNEAMPSPSHTNGAWLGAAGLYDICWSHIEEPLRFFFGFWRNLVGFRVDHMHYRVLTNGNVFLRGFHSQIITIGEITFDKRKQNFTYRQLVAGNSHMHIRGNVW